jgi:hypothetical protein
VERDERIEEVVDPVDGTRWRVDVGFLRSSWTCLWGNGCKGILDEPAESLMQGCCSVGAEMLDEDEAMLVAALGLTLDPARFQHHAEAAEGGVFSDRTRTNTRVVDGACIFFNRPGFDGGTGCALHLAGEDAGESVLDWKPEVCWQLPLRIDRDGATATLRRWSRADWGPDGETMHWCCTERPTRPGQADAYVGDRPVIESLAEEIEALVGPDVFVEITRRAARDTDVDRGGTSATVEQLVDGEQGDAVATDPLGVGSPDDGTLEA